MKIDPNMTITDAMIDKTKRKIESGTTPYKAASETIGVPFGAMFIPFEIGSLIDRLAKLAAAQVTA